MVLQFYCPICHEEYMSSDEIYSSQCGHIFHRQCLQDWLQRSSTCPDCRQPSSTSDLKKIFITSNNIEADDILEKNVTLKSDLDKSVKSLSELQHLLDESQRNFSELQTHYDNVEREREDLMREKNCTDAITKSLENELMLKRAENRSLRNELDQSKKTNNNTTNTSSNDERTFNLAKELSEKNSIIEDLKRSLNEKAVELQKEIRNSTQLIVEKVKLQQLLDASLQRVADVNTINRNANGRRVIVNATNNQTLGGVAQSHLKNLEDQLKKCQLNSFDGTINQTLNAAGGAIRKRPQQKPRLEKAAFDLLQYSRQQLNKVGFAKIFYDENKEIFAVREGYPQIQIVSREQVDNLFQNFKQKYYWQNSVKTEDKKKEDETVAVVPEKCPCDAQFYAI